MVLDHKGHRERLKNRFRKTGLNGFEPHNVLELILFYSIPRRDTNLIAHRLINTFGSFDRVLEADYEDLCRVEGVGKNTATLLKLMLESYRYYQQERDREVFVASSTSATKKFAVSCFVGESREVFYLFCLDSSLRLINRVKVSEGGVSSTPLSVRRVVEIATQNKASAVIMAHNHPSGDVMASASDILATKRMFKALEMIDVELLDHIIVAGNRSISLADAGIIQDAKNS